MLKSIFSRFASKISSLCFVLSVVFVAGCYSTPSIFYNADFDPYEDAKDMHHAVKGPGTDEGLLLEIVTDRTCAQRLEIKRAFQEIYNYDLPKRLGEDTSGTYEQLLKDAFVCGDELFVQHLWRALHNEFKNNDGKHADKSVIEIVTMYSETNERRQALLDGYQKLYNTPLVEDLKSRYKSGNFLDALIQVVTPRNRQPRELIDDNAADNTAEALKNESGNWNDYHDLLTKTLLETSFEQQTSIFHAFQKKTHKDITAIMKSKMHEPLRNLYQDLATFNRWYANMHREYYAIRLKESVDGPGTHESALIRIVLAHTDTDLKELEDQFRIFYTRELRRKIATDTSGDFEALLNAFLPRTPAEEVEKKKKRDELRRKQKERKKLSESLGLPIYVDVVAPGLSTSTPYRTYRGRVADPNMMINSNGMPGAEPLREESEYIAYPPQMTQDPVIVNPEALQNPAMIQQQHQPIIPLGSPHFAF